MRECENACACAGVSSGKHPTASHRATHAEVITETASTRISATPESAWRERRFSSDVTGAPRVGLIGGPCNQHSSSGSNGENQRVRLKPDTTYKINRACTKQRAAENGRPLL